MSQSSLWSTVGGTSIGNCTIPDHISLSRFCEVPMVVGFSRHLYNTSNVEFVATIYCVQAPLKSERFSVQVELDVVACERWLREVEFREF